MKYNYPVKWIKKVRFHWNKVRNRDIVVVYVHGFSGTRTIKNSGHSPYWDNCKKFKKYFAVDIKEIYQEWLKGKIKNDK